MSGTLKKNGKLNQSSVSGGGSVAPTVTGTGVVGQPLTATLPAGVTGTLQFTKTLIASPFTKSNIAGAVANAVNSLQYTVQSGDLPYNIGCDSSSTVSASNSIVPAAAPVAFMYARTKSAFQAVAAGTGWLRGLLAGDSTTGGARANGPAAAAVRTVSPVVRIKERFNAVQALPAQATAWVGDQSFGVTNALSPFNYDARLTAPDGSSWTYTNPSPRTVGGSMLVNATNNSQRLGFLPELAVDTTDVYYPVNTALGSFNLTRTGATTVPVSQVAGASGTQKITITSALDSINPVYATRTSASGSAYLIAMDAYNSAVKSIRLMAAGWSGGKISDIAAATTGFDPLPALIAINPDFVYIRMGTNDAVAGTNVATYKAAYGAYVDALLAAGINVIIATHYPANVASASKAVQDAIAQASREVASERNLYCDDTYTRWVSWDAANANGWMADNLHPLDAGYTAAANDTVAAILSLVA